VCHFSNFVLNQENLKTISLNGQRERKEFVNFARTEKHELGRLSLRSTMGGILKYIEERSKCGDDLKIVLGDLEGTVLTGMRRFADLMDSFQLAALRSMPFWSAKDEMGLAKVFRQHHFIENNPVVGRRLIQLWMPHFALLSDWRDDLMTATVNEFRSDRVFAFVGHSHVPMMVDRLCGRVQISRVIERVQRDSLGNIETATVRVPQPDFFGTADELILSSYEMEILREHLSSEFVEWFLEERWSSKCL